MLADAASLDENNVHALYGAVYCRVLKRNFADAQQELSFLMETMDQKSSHSQNAYLHFLQAVISWQAQHNEELFHTHIGSALEFYSSKLRSSRWAQYQDLAVHDPRFCIMLATEYLKHAPSEPLTSSDPPSAHLREATDILQQLCQRVPGMIDAHLLHAKCKYLAGDVYTAESILLRLKEIDASHWEIYLLQCQVALQSNSHHEAQSALDTVIGLNFQIQSSLVYHVLKARLLRANGKQDAAIELLANVVQKLTQYMAAKNKSPPVDIAQLEQKKTMLFSHYDAQMDEDEFVALCIHAILLLSQLYKNAEQMDNAKQLMTGARSLFQGENELIRIRLSEVRMLLKQGEVDAALNSLHGIPSTSSYYMRSRLLIADIYLKHKRNKKMYVDCFAQLIQNNPNDIHCQLLLGDAYMHIQRTSDAIYAYEQALMMSDYDEKLALKFGRALIASHDYQRAILHFEATLANAPQCCIDVKAELAELYLQFQQYDKAKTLLNDSISAGSETFHDLEANTKMLCLFAELYQNVQRWEDAHSLLVQCWSFQQRLLTMANTSGKNMEPLEKASASICYNLGLVSLRLRHMAAAKEFLAKAIEYDGQHEMAMIEIAKLDIANASYQSARDKLQSLLSMNASNDNAVLLLVNLFIYEQDLKSAIAALRLFREKNPFNIRVLLQLIKLFRRSGQFENIKAVIKAVESAIHDPVSTMKLNSNGNSFNTVSTGLHYLKGYIAWFVDNDASKSIEQLNLLRSDVQWGPAALTLMIRIYLYFSPGVTFVDIVHRLSHSQRAKQLEVAQVLIKELKFFKPDHDPTVLALGCLLLIASQNNHALEKAYKTLSVLCKKYPKHILCHLAFGVCLFAQQLANKALQFLQQFVADNKRDIPISDDERCVDEYQEVLLMIAQLKLLNIANHDPSEKKDDIDGKEELQEIQKLCVEILKTDSSCSKAWELSGILADKQKNLEAACKHFRIAWDLGNHKDVLCGFYLARTLLESHQYMHCIDVGHKALACDAQFVKVQDIIDSALSKLRS